MPAPNGAQLIPSHCATRSSDWPPDIVNSPAATSRAPLGLGQTHSAAHGPLSPAPSCTQLVPVQRAMRRHATPSLCWKRPAAKSVAPLPRSATSRSLTSPPKPAPIADQATPSHCATRRAATEPATVNSPPATSRGPAPASNTSKSSGGRSKPPPENSAVHCAQFCCAAADVDARLGSAARVRASARCMRETAVRRVQASVQRARGGAGVRG